MFEDIETFNSRVYVPYKSLTDVQTAFFDVLHNYCDLYLTNIWRLVGGTTSKDQYLITKQVMVSI